MKEERGVGEGVGVTGGGEASPGGEKGKRKNAGWRKLDWNGTRT